MPTYLVPIINSVGTSLQVDADTPEQAAELVWDSDAFQNQTGSLCHQCEDKVGSLGDWQLTTDLHPRPPTRDEVLAVLTEAADDPHEVENLTDAVMTLFRMSPQHADVTPLED